MCVLFHMVHTQSIRSIIYCSYLLLFRTSVVGNMHTTIIFVPEKIEKWTRVNYHEESTQDEELGVLYNLAGLVAKFSIFFD